MIQVKVLAWEKKKEPTTRPKEAERGVKKTGKRKGKGNQDRQNPPARYPRSTDPLLSPPLFPPNPLHFRYLRYVPLYKIINLIYQLSIIT
jgi:hypothetical protein